MVSYQLDLFLEVHYLREEVRDLLLLPGGVVALSGQFFRQRCDLKVGIAWNDRQDQNLTKRSGFFFLSTLCGSNLPLLTQFFDTVIDKLLLLFLIIDCFCFQMARLIENNLV